MPRLRAAAPIAGSQNSSAEAWSAFFRAPPCAAPTVLALDAAAGLSNHVERFQNLFLSDGPAQLMQAFRDAEGVVRLPVVTPR